LRVIFIKIVALHTAINMLPLQVATHIATVPTQKQGVSVAALDNIAFVISCYRCRKVTVIENTVMEETDIQNNKKGIAITQRVKSSLCFLLLFVLVCGCVGGGVCGGFC
jgi:hypothetical protein